MRSRRQTARVQVFAAKRPSALPYILFALFLLFLSSQANAQGYGKAGEVRWERKRWAHDELPATLPAPVRDAIADWGPWSEARGYHLLLDETQQVLLAVERRDRTAAKQLRVIDEALRVIEELALAKDNATTPSTQASSDTSTARPLYASTSAGEGTPGDAEKRWGRAAGLESRRLPVIALVHDHATLNSILRHWMALRPELEWQEKIAQNYGSFISEDPLFAVIVTRKTERSEWDLDHETAALLTRLMLKRAHGPLPMWIEAGLTWQVETHLFQSIWHFFHRESRFIPSSSHSGWEREVRSLVRRRKQGAGLFEDASNFDPKEWRDREAYLAWGLMGFLTHELGGRLPQCLARLSDLRDESARIDHPDGSWTYDTSVLPSISEQFTTLADLLGDDFEERALKAFQRGLKRSGELR